MAVGESRTEKTGSRGLLTFTDAITKVLKHHFLCNNNNNSNKTQD